jgi:hypothetical protein
MGPPQKETREMLTIIHFYTRHALIALSMTEFGRKLTSGSYANIMSKVSSAAD